ncbi:MAG: ABC transporter permease [Candidatus Ratteibacteria bacterium]|nr:ABC transporter permease [Candidatus Ratteibacteria bacterium]
MKNIVTQRNGIHRFFLQLGNKWAIIFLILGAILFSIISPGFLSFNGIQVILINSPFILLLGLAETFVIITGGIDLSVGFVMGFASVVSAKLIAILVELGMNDLLSITIGIVITLVIGIIPGFVNGVLVARLKVPSFIATFSMIGITHGVSELLIKGVVAKNLPVLAGEIGNGSLIYIVPGRTVSFFIKPLIQRGAYLIEILPTVFLIPFIFILISAFILKRTKFGQHTYAIGGNVDAAIRAGINVKTHIIKIYMLSSFLATVAGIMYVLRYITGKADAGTGFLMDGIAAVVIGGASLYGGVGSVWKTTIGCFIILVLENGLRMLGFPTFYKYILVGIVLIFAVLVDKLFPELIHKEE